MSYLLTFILFLPLVCAPAWDLREWQPITQQCAAIAGDTLIMECQSAGLITKQWYDAQQPIHVAVDVQAGPAVGSTTPRYWSGIALNANVAADDRYAEAAVMQGIAPWEDSTEPFGVMLATPADTCCDVLVNAATEDWHHLAVDYAGGLAVITIDGVRRSTKVALEDKVQVELLCVAVNPGESKPGALSRCQFRNLVILAV